MTREEIENIPKNINTLLDLSVTIHTRQKLDEKLNKVCELAIKTLEQKPVLDKIRAEIDKARFIDKNTRIVKNALASGLEVALQIIDKYKAESEEINGR